MLVLSDISLSLGRKVLLQSASLTIYAKQIIGLIGRNGCGKSSLFKVLLGELEADSGEIIRSDYLRISHLAQTLPDSSEPAIDYVLAGDDVYWRMSQKLKAAELAEDADALSDCHDWMIQHAGYSKPALAASILAGLGFSEQAQQQSVRDLSGGWRMRLNLARCLMKPADLLLLDEPTNHLDMDAIVWLERWLGQIPASVVVISHDRDFLDNVVSHIAHIEHHQLTLYPGDYSQFERIRAEKLALQQTAHEKQQKKIAHLMSFVDRFRAKATKAKQAQSRLKAIEKMDVVANAHLDSPFSFQFFPSTVRQNTLLQMNQVSLGYEDNHAILKEVNLTLQAGARIGLLGPNGQGKSTLLKAIVGDLSCQSGSLSMASAVKIGYFAQHHLSLLDKDASPITIIQRLTLDASEQSIRNFLGGFDFGRDMVSTPCRQFSGGEQSRLLLASIVWQRPNLLILDEPTNHLDLDMRAALECALLEFEGALILVSHDRHLMRSAVDELYVVYQQALTQFKGDLSEYGPWIQERQTVMANKPGRDTGLDHKLRRQYQNRLKRLEQMLADNQKKLKHIEVALADESLYESPNQAELDNLIRSRDRLVLTIDDAEAEWMEVMDKLGE